VSAALGKDYVDVKIDTDRMTGGDEVAKRLRKTERGGIPWSVIIDAEEQPLVTSDGPDGNIGCPVQPEERAWFLQMIEKTRRHMTDEDLAVVKSSLDAFAEEILSRQKQR